MRNFDQTPDEAYYQRMKLQYDKEKPKTFKSTVEKREKMYSDEEDIKRMKAEFDQIHKEKEEKSIKIQENKEKKKKKEKKRKKKKMKKLKN